MTNSFPLVSVIVPSYNHEKYLVQRLDSIVNQSYVNFEVILLDDCSPDNSHEILLEYAKHPKVSSYVFNETNSGNTFGQWAKGISLAKGEFIWIAETDDFCDLNFLEIMIKPFLEDEEVVLAYCQSNRVNEFNELTGTWFDHTEGMKKGAVFSNDFIMDGNKFIQDFLIYKNVIPNASAVLYRKNKIIIDKHFNVDSYFKYCGDWIFYFRLLVDAKVAFVAQNCNNFRYHSTSVIARAAQAIDYIEIINIDFKMRDDMIQYLSLNGKSDLTQIKRNNRKWVKELMYTQANLYYRNGKKRKALKMFGQIPAVLFKKSKYRKKVSKVIKRVVNSIKAK
jgi:glycosyltransferase involved in cell wall biosynthesis